jgi:hypothetical protein
MAVDIIVVLFAGYLCFQGYRKGFILTVFDTLGLIISFFLSKRFYYYAEDFLLNNTKLFVKLHDYFETALSINDLEKMSKIPVELQKFVNNIMATAVFPFRLLISKPLPKGPKTWILSFSCRLLIVFVPLPSILYRKETILPFTSLTLRGLGSKNASSVVFSIKNCPGFISKSNSTDNLQIFFEIWSFFTTEVTKTFILFST